ncbi:hypothetical protein K438DRAFT_1584066 [Mycena galopus ATCC 62051]|nr:hypothetical protein K438DRAFT_1584066 [Mycena galopus ATCC 62051]
MSTTKSGPHPTDDLVLHTAEHPTPSHATSGDVFDALGCTVPQGPVSTTESIFPPLNGGEAEGSYNQEDENLGSVNPVPPPPSPATIPPPSRPASPPYDDDEPWEGILNDSDEEPWGGISGNHGVDALPAPTNIVRKPFPHLGHSDDDNTLPEVEGVTTWASRNPGKAVLPPRRRPKRVVGAEQRRTAKDRVKSKKRRTTALLADIAEINRDREALVRELATKHKFKPKLVKQRLSSITTYKKPRKISLFRAKLHYLAKVLNHGLCFRLSMHDVRRRVKTYPEFQNMSTTFKEKLVKDLAEFKKTKATGARATNKAVAQDAAYILKRISTEIDDLLERAGMYGFAMFSKGHVHDLTVPYFMQSGGAMAFFREVLRMDPADVLAKFELWCCARDKGFTGLDTLASMRREVTNLIKTGLSMFFRTKCAMNYERYIKVVVLGYGCALLGWPHSVNFTSPTNISTVDDMRTLRDALKDGTCRWKVLSTAEKEKWRLEYDEKVESGEIVEQVRKVWGDKGEERGPNARTVRKRAAGERSKSKSKSMVVDSDEEEEDEEDDRDSNEERAPRKKSRGTVGSGQRSRSRRSARRETLTRMMRVWGRVRGRRSARR